MKRIILFLATNIAVMLVLSVVLSVLGVDRFLTRSGLDIPKLMVFSLIVGFAGSIFSLLISKWMAKRSTGAHVIVTPSNSTEVWLLDTVSKLAQRAGIGMPEVAVFQGEPNAFATGAFKNSALVAVSTGLLESMTKEEVEAVLGHEIAHIANGDMVTMTLIQGVLNTFVVFLSRVIGYAVDRAISRNNNDGPGIGYMVSVLVTQVVLGIGASIIVAWFSRHREFRADAGAAKLMGSSIPMQRALARLGGGQAASLPESMAAMGINDKPGFMALFSSHPPIEQRIAALRNPHVTAL
ncbi:protease HtpX [Glaciimonas immobilis]|uniref:Protease HtpX homolog n=1 Tax=Glaciimonas immobilis TaxID=728004 RepID=A0A840RVJ4_9BURK|nr:protease HtpX [Glaciimonas immobilis]KAF3998270.1 protease HtpX [Glaciimonas immobilis]MBB5201885.1 heat shock protein HtpX [Glaciimonas immobilis]